MTICVLGDGILADTIAHCLRQRGHDVTDFFHVQYDALWLAYDTKSLPDGTPDHESVERALRDRIEHPNCTNPVLISSRLLVGATRRLAKQTGRFPLFYIPENIRTASAVPDFMHQQRIVVGQFTREYDGMLRKLLEDFTDNIVFTDWETAELSKHALNGFLALCIAYGNEVAGLAKAVGANPTTVAECLLSDPRIGSKLPLRPGGGPGECLLREVHNLNQLAIDHGTTGHTRLNTPVIEAILESAK